MNIEEHLTEEHEQSPISEYMREIAYGGLDGIITTFAIVAGFAGAEAPQAVTQLTAVPVLLFGFANLCADGLSMGLSNFLSLRSEKDQYRAEKEKERQKIYRSPHLELKETIAILIAKGYKKADAQTMAKLYAKNKPYWTDFMMNQELKMSNPEHKSIVGTSLATFFSFVLFGLIPLVPYFVVSPSASSFIHSITATGAALLLLGLLRWKIIKEGGVRSVAETLLLGTVAASTAYLVGTFFRAA